ncbi:uncharacterized protein LOC143039961 isoform X2 [Oratosquilla oratoria]
MKDLHKWWTSELIFDPISPVHSSMKEALAQAAEDRWKDESIVWAALLKSYLFESVTIDCICGSTGSQNVSEQVDENLYQEILSIIGPLPLKKLELISGNLCAWQTRMVRDLLCHSPKVTSVKVPLLTHYILDGIARTPNLEKLEMAVAQNWKDWSFSCGKLYLIEKVAKVFLGSEDLCSLIENAGKPECLVRVPYPKLKQFNIAIDHNTTELCHLLSCYYPNVKLGQFYVPCIEYFSYLIAFKRDHKMWGVGSFFQNELKDCYAPSPLHFDHLILGDITRNNGISSYRWNMVGLTKLDIFSECNEESTVFSDFLDYCHDVFKLGITSMNILSGISSKPGLLQVTCLELSPKINLLDVFAHLHKFPNLRHFMCFYPIFLKVNVEGSKKFLKIDELTISFSSKETVPETELMKFFMASFPSLQRLHLKGVTQALWTSGWLVGCGQTSVKSLTLTTEEELCNCSFEEWLEVFPKLEDFTLQSAVLHRQCLPASSRLKIKYCGFVCPFLEWFDGYEYDDKLYPIDEE